MGYLRAVFGLGPQGILDQIMGKAVGSTFKGVGGFVSGVGRGAAGIASNAHNVSGLGKITHAMGYGAGKAGRTAVGAVTSGASAGSGLLRAGLTRDWNWLKNTSYGVWRNATMDVPKELADVGIIGIGGKIAKPGVAWAIGLGAVAYGGLNAADKFDYNMGLKTLTNGIMDTQGVSLTPGSIGASYTPVRNSKKAIRDLGATGELGFALHAQRNTGQF